MDSNPLSPLKPAEYEALKDSIRRHGIRVPVIITPDGRVIDGHHRKQIAEELGMDCPYEVQDFKDQTEELAMALGLNLQRRQLDDYSAGLANLSLLELRGVKLGRGQRNPDGLRTEDVAREAGQNLRTFNRRCQLARLLAREDMRDLKEAYLREELSMQEVVAIARKRLQPQPPHPDPTKLGVKPARHMGAVAQAHAEGLQDGLSFAHELLHGVPPTPGWLEGALYRYEELQRQAAGSASSSSGPL